MISRRCARSWGAGGGRHPKVLAPDTGPATVGSSPAPSTPIDATLGPAAPPGCAGAPPPPSPRCSRVFKPYKARCTGLCSRQRPWHGSQASPKRRRGRIPASRRRTWYWYRPFPPLAALGHVLHHLPSVRPPHLPPSSALVMRSRRHCVTQRHAPALQHRARLRCGTHWAPVQRQQQRWLPRRQLVTCPPLCAAPPQVNDPKSAGMRALVFLLALSLASGARRLCRSLGPTGCW